MAPELNKPPAARLSSSVAPGLDDFPRCFGLINDPQQWPINILNLQRPSLTHFWDEN